MAHGKLYRNFIILQEDERGHSTAQDKPLSGYAKVEAKDDKCKISFYAQNLKKDEHKHFMMIVSAKKDMRQLMNLGEVNITDIGKVDGYKEFSVNNIGGMGLGYDKISGAAIVKKVGDKLEFLISGFMSNEMPKDDWKQYPVVNSVDLGKFTGSTIYSQITSPTAAQAPTQTQGTMQSPTAMQSPGIMAEGNGVINGTTPEVGNGVYETPYDGMGELPLYEDAVPTMGAGSTMNGQGSTMGGQGGMTTGQVGTMGNQGGMMTGTGNMQNQPIYSTPGTQGGNMYNTTSPRNVEIDNKPLYDSSYTTIGRNIGGAKPPIVEEDTIEVRSEFDEYENKIVDDYSEENFKIRGSVGEFFESLAEDFELDRHKNKKKDIKHCKWYKVPVDNLDEMCNIADYNKYTVIYYPMINYYPYFKKHKHYCIGYKCNDKGKMKYIVYGIPGKKDKGDQPYGGKTGFVTWMEDETLGDGMGYWLMFYDFRNSVIVIPAER